MLLILDETKTKLKMLQCECQCKCVCVCLCMLCGGRGEKRQKPLCINFTPKGNPHGQLREYLCVFNRSPTQTILVSQQLLTIHIIYNETRKEQCYNSICMVHED